MNYITNWTDKSSISMSGWSGSVAYNSSKGYLELTATNGWRTFGWNLPDIVGKNVTLEFDYIMINNGNSAFSFVTNIDAIGYGSAIDGVNLVDNTTQWNHKTVVLSSAKQFIGINVRGVDNTGLSTTLAIKNVILHATDDSNFGVEKTGVMHTGDFVEVPEMKQARVGKNIVIANNFYEY